MSLHLNSMGSPQVERAQSSKPVHTDDKPAHRLYPCLPNIDRYEVCLPVRSVKGRLNPTAEFPPQLEESEGSFSISDSKMMEQMLILKEQRKELLSINEKWAREYRTMVQYYKEKLRFSKEVQQCDHSTEETCEKEVTLNRKVKTVKYKENTQEKSGEVSSELLKAEKEVRELRVQNNTLTLRGQHQHEEIRRLNKALVEALQPSQSHSEKLQDIWKHQAEVYKEDFLKERRDREKLKEKYLELEKKFRKVHFELHVLKTQATPGSGLQCACTSRTKCPDHVHLQRRCTPDSKQ
ncbi:TNFAIP3-interacting protein 1-like [Mugil cephalus]|uniref:TNFAIP3-interacting protein 1-like n=1 Tax=Mugil cephalus TaxID=48193 RepID=UPI001FB7B81F|nr:TNFAIP3-interacting protein 1-like [Mugil cephalus]